MLYSGKTLDEIASYDRTQMFRVILRRRDRYGRLIRNAEDLPRHVLDSMDENGRRVVKNPTPMSTIYHKIKRRQGLSEDQIKKRWEAYQEANPKMGKGGTGQGRRAAIRRSGVSLEED